ncbi:MAG: STAS domain-containing protein [Solirubrobacteraceae bacterium]
MALLEVDTHEENGTIRVALVGELDISSAPRVEEEIERLEAAKPAVLVLDLRGLAFMDSTGLRLIVGADARAREQGRRLAIVRGPDVVQRIFRVTRLDERLDMVDDPAGLATA